MADIEKAIEYIKKEMEEKQQFIDDAYAILKKAAEDNNNALITIQSDTIRQYENHKKGLHDAYILCKRVLDKC